MAEYIEYHPLKFWLDPASIAEIVAHIQTYLVNNPINSTTEIETIIHDYLIAHPELIGGVDSVNGQTGEVVLTADNISAGENVTIKDVLDSLQDQIDDIIASIPSDYQQLINDVSDLKSAFDTVINDTDGFINYDYDTPFERDADPTADNSLALGVKRTQTVVTFNTTNLPKNTRTRLNGDVVTTNSNATVAGWEGLSLKAGHAYQLKLQYVSGTYVGVGSKLNTPLLSVYRSGEYTSMSTNEQGTDYYTAKFTAEENTTYNLCTYIPLGTNATDATYIITLEDLSVRNHLSLEEYDKYNLEHANGAFKFINGGYSRAGAKLSTAQAARYLIQADYVQDEVLYARTKSDGYKLIVIAFNNDVFAGFLTAENTLSNVSSDPLFWADEISFIALRNRYPDYKFRIEITTADTASGTAANITPPEEVNIELVKYGSPEIRPYYTDEMANTISTARDAINEPALVFPLVTDIHYLSSSNYSGLFDVCADNIKYLCDRLPCDFVLNLGDNTDGNLAPDETIRRSKHMLEQFAKTQTPYLFVIGNHDTNYYQGGTLLTAKETFASYFSNTKDVVFDPTGFSYYKDVESLGIRAIVLCVNYLKQYKINADTVAWLSETALNTDKMVLLCEHLSSIPTQNWSGQALTNGTDLQHAIQSFVNGGGTLIQLCGHSHADYYFNDPWPTIFSCCQKFEQVDTTAGGFLDISGNVGGNAGIVAPARALSTATEDLWNVCVLKPLSKEIDFIRFGAGVDRYFHFGKTVIENTLTLTTILDAVIWSTSDGSVATVSDGVVTAVGSGLCQITATDNAGNFETWTVSVA